MSASILPPELLIDIFKTAIDDNAGLHQRAALALVSKLWRDIVYDSPVLWTSITSSDVGPRSTLALIKSQQLPLDVILTPVSHPNLRVQESFKEVCGQLHRWRTGWLHIPSLLLGHLASPAPLLETLYLDFAEKVAMDGYMDLFRGQAPRLSSVHLGRVAIPWGNGILSGLETLELEKIPPDWCPTIEHLMLILDASPRLRVLHLLDIDFDWPDDDHPAKTVSLPHLQVLHLSEINPWAVYRILDLIDCSPCRELDVSCEVEDEEDIEYLACLAGLAPRELSNESKVELFIRRRRIEYTLSSAPTHQKCHIRLEGSDPDLVTHMVHTLAQEILPASHLLVDAKLILWRHDQPIADVLAWMETADAFHVTSLKISGVDEILDRLATNPGGRWLFPALVGLVLEVGDTTPGGLTRMIRCRHDEAGSGLARLVSLTIDNVYEDHEADVAAVKEILGAERVVWSY